MDKYAKTFIGAVLAGICIGLGGLAYIALIDNKIVGALLFTIGLFTICTMKFNLFTGKVCYVFDNGLEYALSLPVIWVGNLVGTAFCALFASLTRYGKVYGETAKQLCVSKAEDSLLSLFFLGLLCNVFIYIAVDGFANNPHQVGKYLSLIFGVTVFILTKTEHCVADMFYIWMGRAWNGRTILAILVITLGNCAGGIMIPLFKSLASDKE